MARKDYYDGRSMNYAQWNIFANLINKDKDIYNDMYTFLGTSQVSAGLVDTKLNTDVLNGAVAQLGTLSSELNTQLDSLGIYSYVYSFNNATNITENETLSWYDSTMQLSTELLDIDNDLRLSEAAYVSNSYILETNLEISDTNNLYTLIGEIRYGDLSKSYMSSNNNHSEYTLPDGNLIISVGLIQRYKSDFETDFDTSEGWDDIDITIDNLISAYDGINVINYTNAFIRFTEGDFDKGTNDNIRRIYSSTIVDVYDTDGNLLSSNQYNNRIDEGDDLFISGFSSSELSLATSFRKSLDIDYESNFAIDSLGRLMKVYSATVDLEKYIKLYDGDDRYIGKSLFLYSYGMGAVISKTGIIDSYQNRFTEVGSTYFEDDSAGQDYDISTSYNIPTPQIAQSSNGSVMVLGVATEYEITYEKDGELRDADASALIRFMRLGVDSSGNVSGDISYEYKSYLDVNPSTNIDIFVATDNISSKIYAGGYISTERDGDVSSPDGEERSRAILLEFTPTATNTIADYEIEDTNSYYHSVEVKLAPNYETNLSELHWRIYRNNNGTRSYIYNTSETEYLNAPNSSVFIKDGRISDGVDWYGVEYTFNRPDNTPCYPNFGRQRKYLNMDYGGLLIGTDGSNITDDMFTLYHSRPNGTLKYISNTEF